MAESSTASRVKPGMDRRRDLRAGKRPPLGWKASTPSLVPAASASAGPRQDQGRRNSPAPQRCPISGICLGMQMAVLEAAREPGRTWAMRIGRSFDHESEKSVYPVVYHLQGNGCRATTGEGANLDRRQRRTMRRGAMTAAAGRRDEGGRGLTDRFAIEEPHPATATRSTFKVSRGARGAGAEFFPHVADGRPARDRRGRDHPWFIGWQFPPRAEIQAFSRRTTLFPRFRACGQGKIRAWVVTTLRRRPSPRRG